MRTIFALAALLPAVLWAQLPSQGKPDPVVSPTGKQFDTLFFKTNIGSFRFVGTQEMETNKRVPAEGRLEVVFTGTLLINNLEGRVTTSGKLRKEYDGRGRVGYFGSGKVIVEGRFWAVQAFGQEIDGRWTGWGMGRLYGEFDRNLYTGEYWFARDPKKQFWSSYGSTITLPTRTTAGVTPRERKPGGGG